MSLHPKNEKGKDEASYIAWFTLAKIAMNKYTGDGEFDVESFIDEASKKFDLIAKIDLPTELMWD